MLPVFSEVHKPLGVSRLTNCQTFPSQYQLFPFSVVFRLFSVMSIYDQSVISFHVNRRIILCSACVYVTNLQRIRRQRIKIACESPVRDSLRKVSTCLYSTAVDVFPKERLVVSRSSCDCLSLVYSSNVHEVGHCCLMAPAELV